MGRLFAAAYDRVTAEVEAAGLAAWRAELLAGLHGRVLEIGAGTGRNLVHYPPAVSELVLTEPDRFMRARLAQRTQAVSGRAVELIDAPAERLGLEDHSVDGAVSTLVLCSVADQAAALAELRRVLRPGGQLVFIEHVAASDNPKRLVWQRRIDPVWRRLADGCRLTRDTEGSLVAAGFKLDGLRRQSMRKALPIVRPTIRGVATAPA